MEHFIIYMVKASAIMGVFYLAYYLLLRKETFFTSNRWFLIAGLFTSVVLPLVVYTKVIWIDPAPTQEYREIGLDQLMMLQHAAKATAQAPVQINWFDVATGIYLAGALFFLIRFIIEIVSLKRMLKGIQIIKDGKFLMVDSPLVKSPFSFFSYIVYNSSALLPGELENIISHEKVHSSQRHSLDMVIGQLFCVAFWFNPFAWIYKKSISQNLEFIADAEATKQLADKESYQKTLLKITVQPECIAITNHFFQSLIKKRIVMLNKPQSKKQNSWKYAIVLPALAAFMLLFQVKVVAQEKENTSNKEASSTKIKLAVEVTKDSKDAELAAESNVFKEEFDADLSFQNITRNQQNEITGIKVTVKDKSQSKVYEVAGTDPINPFTVEVEKGGSSTGNSITFGTPRRVRVINSNAYYAEADSITGNHRIIRGHISSNNGDDVIVVPAPPAAPGHPAPPAHAVPGRAYVSAAKGNWSVDAMKIGNDDMLIVINGVKQEKGETIKLPLNEEIAEMKILKDKEGKKKYGKDGKKGVVEITTKKNNSWAMMRNPEAYLRAPENNGQTLGFSFNFTDEDVAQIKQGLDDLGKLNLEDFNLGNILSAEELKGIEAELSRTQIELQKSIEELKFDPGILSDTEIAEIKKELEQARKEIVQAKKELQRSRTEAMKEKKEAAKEKEQTKKTAYKKA